MSPVQLQVIPDEWTGLPPFIPGDDTVRIALRAGELILSARQARELFANHAGIMRAAESAAEMVRRLGTPAPAVPERRA